MTLILSGTNGLSDVDGSAATPAIRGTDANTGIFFPAADTIAFSEGGAEVARFDSSGNLGIGTSSPSYRLHVSAAGNTIGGYFYTPSGLSGIRIETAANDKAVAEFYTNGNRNWSIGPGQTTAGAFEFRDVTAASTRMLIDSSGNFAFNSGYGSVATAYACRAWVNFNGTGTVAIRASGNVSSITDVGTGSYTVNFTTAMPDANYAAMSVSPLHSYVSKAAAPTTSGFSIVNEAFSGAVTDYDYISAAVFR